MRQAPGLQELMFLTWGKTVKAQGQLGVVSALISTCTGALRAQKRASKSDRAECVLGCRVMARGEEAGGRVILAQFSFPPALQIFSKSLPLTPFSKQQLWKNSHTLLWL